MAGWVVRKVAEEPEISGCKTCEKLLLEREDHEHSYSQVQEEDTFISRKKYCSTSRLLVPSKVLKEGIQRCEAHIRREMPTLLRKRNITKHLKTSLRAAGVFAELHKTHPSHSKKIEEVALRKFIMCRVGAELRQRNVKQIKHRGEKATAKRKLSCFTEM